MFYTVYKITNKVNGKIYIGTHQTNDLDDGYMGSGTYLKKVQETIGIEHFDKEILKICDSASEMYEMEFNIVDDSFINRHDTYNLVPGGGEGWRYINDRNLNLYGSNSENMKLVQPLGVARRKWLLTHDKDWLVNYSLLMSKAIIASYENGRKNGFEGKSHSEETKKKMSEARKGKVSGENNPSFGSMWIHNLEEKLSKKIKKEEFSDWEAKGWLKGRKMKFN